RTERRANLRRVVRVIVDNGDAVARLDLKSPIDAVEPLQRARDDIRLNPHVTSGRKRSSCIQDVVHPGNFEPDFLHTAAVESNSEYRAEPFVRECGNANVGGGGGAIRDDSTFDFRYECLHSRIVNAEDGGSIERYFVDEREERRLDILEVAIVVEVVRFDV